MSFWKKPAESAGYLSGVAFFEGFSNEDLARVASLSGELKVGSGAMVIDQGDTGVDCYVIMEGTASVRVRDEEVATLGSGDMVGEMALIDHRPRTASVVATHSSQVEAGWMFTSITPGSGATRMTFSRGSWGGA